MDDGKPQLSKEVDKRSIIKNNTEKTPTVRCKKRSLPASFQVGLSAHRGRKKKCTENLGRSISDVSNSMFQETMQKKAVHSRDAAESRTALRYSTGSIGRPTDQLMRLRGNTAASTVVIDLTDDCISMPCKPRSTQEDGKKSCGAGALIDSLDQGGSLSISVSIYIEGIELLCTQSMILDHAQTFLNWR